MTVLEAVLPGEDWVTLTSALLHAPFYFYVSYSLIRYLFHDDRVTTDELYAIGAAFTVVAWGFAYVYLAVAIIWPGSIEPLRRRAPSRFFDLLFFSFTNLTSVGLSDILPVGDHARSVVILEQVAGRAVRRHGDLAAGRADRPLQRLVRLSASTVDDAGERGLLGLLLEDQGAGADPVAPDLDEAERPRAGTARSSPSGRRRPGSRCRRPAYASRGPARSRRRGTGWRRSRPG